MFVLSDFLLKFCAAICCRYFSLLDFPAVDKLAHYDFNKKAPSESQLIEMGAMKSISPTGLQQTMKSKVDGSFTSITSPTNSVSGDVTMPLPDTPHRNSFSQVRFGFY